MARSSSSNVEYQAIEYLLIRDKIDMGVLKPFLSDSYIEDISCDGVGPIFIEHKIFKGLKSVIEFKVSSELDDFVVKIAERIKRPITYRSPIVDSTPPGWFPYQHRLRDRDQQARQQLLYS